MQHAPQQVLKHGYLRVLRAAYKNMQHTPQQVIKYGHSCVLRAAVLQQHLWFRWLVVSAHLVRLKFSTPIVTTYLLVGS